MNAYKRKMKKKDYNNWHTSPGLAEMEVNYKSKKKFDVKLSNSKDVNNLLKSIWSNKIEMQEEFCVLYLNKANRVLGWARVSTGGIAGTVTDTRIIFGIAVKSLASAVILAHNHPSGNLKPSDSDKAMTRKLKEAGKILDITVLDHLIITPEGGFYSFADEGLM